MAVAAPVNRPKAFQYLQGGTPSFRPTLADNNASAFKAYQFVYITGAGPTAVLNQCTAGQFPPLVYGLAVEDASATGTGAANIPPAVLYAGTSSVCDTNDTLFVVNITDGSGTIGSGTTSQGAVTLGNSYSMIYAGSGDTNTQMLNAAGNNASLAFFKVEGFFPDDASTSYNGRVIVSLAATRQ
jgi:hypothetical protein